MKIICIGQNYYEHCKELNSQVPKEPMFFMKPDTALPPKPSMPFFYPDFSNEIHYEIELVAKICRLGKNIEEKFAHKYYEEISVGIDFTARDLQRECKDNGMPWEKAKSFDGSAQVGTFVKKDMFPDLNNVPFSLNQNGKTVQQGNSKDMIFSFDKIIAYVSQFVTLKIGDHIYTGTPVGVGPVKIGDILEGYIANEKLLEVKVK